jgi:glutamine phosphoribosylpyrophosphate amidotransferase
MVELRGNMGLVTAGIPRPVRAVALKRNPTRTIRTVFALAHNGNLTNLELTQFLDGNVNTDSDSEFLNLFCQSFGGYRGGKGKGNGRQERRMATAIMPILSVQTTVVSQTCRTSSFNHCHRHETVRGYTACI